ncbi:hypothetical protein P5V15_002863 [Pogonomyrmex californicus]
MVHKLFILPYSEGRPVSSTTSKNNINNMLLKKKKRTDKFKKIPVLFTKADKKNVIVAVDRDTYVAKIKDMLCDNNTYTIINKSE